MTKQMLIYSKATPLSSEKHRDWSIKPGKDFSFAADVNAVPLMAVEFPSSASEYTIVFAGEKERVMPVVILGMREGENLYLEENGTWGARYVPAFLRRYPFVFASSDDGKAFTLCVDEEFEGCNTEGKGERLFDAEGEHTQYLKSVLAFLQEYQAQFQRTRALCTKLQELKLLEPMQAMFRHGSGEQTSLAGFFGIERERLKALSGDDLVDLSRTGALELAYLQLHSMRNLAALANRLTPRQAPPPELDDTAPETTGKVN